MHVKYILTVVRLSLWCGLGAQGALLGVAFALLAPLGCWWASLGTLWLQGELLLTLVKNGHPFRQYWKF